MIDYRPATSEDICHVAEHMRAVDIEELKALHGQDPLTALEQSVALTERPYAAVNGDGVAIAILGIGGDPITGHGMPWLLGTEEVARHPREMVRSARRMVKHGLQSDYRAYSGVVHVENTPSVRYLTALGFKMSEPFKVPMTGAMAMTFTMERGDV